MRLNEGLDYHDLKGQIEPKITVDEYAAKMGADENIVTMTFKTNSKLAADDLVAWLEIGYDFILDASTSDGEIEPGKWLVFVEMKRRSNIPEKIVQILSDLDTLTDIKSVDYVVTFNDDDYDANVDVLKQALILTPGDYKKMKGEDELNEMRQIAGLKNKKIYDNVDNEIRHIMDIAKI